MLGRRATGALLGLAVLAPACSSAVSSSPVGSGSADPAAVTTLTESDPAAVSSTTSTTTEAASSTRATTTTSTAATTSTIAATTTTAPATTTTTLPPLDVHDAACVVRVEPGDTLLELVIARDDYTIDVQSVMAENDLDSDDLAPRQLLDVCVDNGIDDITGETRTRNAAIVRREVEAQQAKLNELFSGYGIDELLVDGVSGPVTRQRLCAFRLAVGLPVSTADMEAGSDEEQQLMATDTLPIPFTSAILSERWILIDQTCQIMFVGVGTERLEFVFPTSTGLAEFPTRSQNRTRAFKYDSASDNNGWHDSRDFPASEDNPLNGNMYRPLYFDGGQAIHGANNVPRSPASHGCARLRVAHQEMLINWLGLGDVTGATYDKGRINVTVNVQGRYQG